MKRPKFKDLASLTEDARIAQIVACFKHGTIGVLVDDDPEIAQRYINKILKLRPDAKVIYRGKGPTPGCMLIKMRTQNPEEN